MRNTKLLAAAGFTVLCHLACAAEMDLIVHLYDKFGVDKLQLGSAKRVAAGLLLDAGLRVRFVDCTARSCDGAAAGPRTFVMSVDYKVPARLQTALGYALPFAAQANRASLNYSKIEKASPLHTEYLLGSVIAHELAHLLYRSAEHGSGLMREQFTAADMRAMRENRLAFSAEQASHLRAGLQAREALSLQ